MNDKQKKEFLQKMRDLIDGYCCADPGVDGRHLRRLGIKRLTETKGLNGSPGHPANYETDIERKMAPLVSNSSADRYFAASRDGIQFIIVEHQGQWYVGNDACEEPAPMKTIYAFFCRSKDEDGEVKIELARVDKEFSNAAEASEALVAFLSQTDGAYIDSRGFVHEIYEGKDQVYCKYLDHLDQGAIRELHAAVKEMGLEAEASYLEWFVRHPSLLESVTGPCWDFVLDDTAEGPDWKHNVGMLTNGRRYIFFRSNENNICSFYFDIGGFSGGYADMDCAWCSGNDTVLLDILNSEDAESPDFQKRVKERFDKEKNEGPLFVKAIIAWFKEKGCRSVYFQPNTYEFEDDIPFCHDAGLPVETVFIPDEPVHGDGIGIIVWSEKDGAMQKYFDGTEPDEDFDYLFHETWYYINDPEDGEADDWFEEFRQSLKEPSVSE